MHKFEHKQLIADLLAADHRPTNSAEFDDWIKANEQLEFLTTNVKNDELAIYVNGPFSYVRSVLVPCRDLTPLDTKGLINWNLGAYDYRASYVHFGGNDRIEIEYGISNHGIESLKNAQNIIFHRNFEGWAGGDRNYVEALQEFVHLAEIHWRPEESAYCKFDENGDLHQILSVTLRESDPNSASLVSVERDTLDEFLAASNMSLLRLFDFTLVKRHEISGWGEGNEKIHARGKSLHYKQRINPGVAAYTRGFQLVSPRLGYEGTKTKILEQWSDNKPKKYITFKAWNWRDKVVQEISTDPAATTNYFEMNTNDLPHDLSPAFFNPAVLTRYKADKDKYTIKTRRIHCRATWTLKSYDINSAGQVHAYICDLRNLPYKEQLHWLSFNEKPKAFLSNRAVTTDFNGQFSDETDPLDVIKFRLRRWSEQNFVWWQATADDLFDRATTPASKNRDEWAEAFMDLSKLVIEGFRTKAIKILLREKSIDYEQNEQSIRLLERLRNGNDQALSDRFVAMRAIQMIRSKAKGHSGSGEAIKIAQTALKQHGSYRAHFEEICRDLDDELNTIENVTRNS